jgi:mono/diheme cytochrome c family protein
MTTTSPRSLKLRKILFAVVLALIGVCIFLALTHRTPWIIPAYEKQRKNPIAPSEAGLQSSRVMYLDKCANCHGETGKGDGSDAMMYDPGPADFTDAKHMNSLTDGEIFYQITAGRKPMPAFWKRLSEEQRWQLVLLVRSFAAPAPPRPALQNTSESPAKHP